MQHRKGQDVNSRTLPGVTAAAPPTAIMADAADMALIMRLSGEAFGIPVRIVNEIIDPIHITRVPNAPAFAPGLINVRGAVVPVLDLRHRLRMQPSEPQSTARIVVIETALNGELVRLAIMADAVEEVVEVDLGKLEPVPDLGAPWPDIYVLGVLRYAKGLVVVLNGDTLFRPEPVPTSLI